MVEKAKEIELSVILPYVQEYPQVAFTAQSIINELRGNINFELIVIDNWCNEVAEQGRPQDKGSTYMESIAKINDEMVYLKYDKKLSHWNAKNLGVAHAKGKFLWFCDSHCLVSPGLLTGMVRYYREHHTHLNGTLHAPLSYLLDTPGRSLIYKLAGDIDKGEVHYSFTRFNNTGIVTRVPCMSTCGMMMTRQLFDDLGGWPEQLGIYGGGENFINFTLATLGKTINIFPYDTPLWHFAEKRGYHWNFDDHLRNRMLATYLFGGYSLLKLFTAHAKGSETQKRRLMESVITNPTCIAHRQQIEKKQVVSIQDWWATWKAPSK